jgi:phosphoribosylanthranilate isomerase
MPSLRIKICGITTPADAELAARLGADALGLNFYARSPRALGGEDARAILAVLPPFVEPVGLFVNEGFEHIHSAAKWLNLRTLQLHGDRLDVLPRDSYRYWTAFAVRDTGSLGQIDAYLEACRRDGQLPAALLLDAHVAGIYGGSGQTAPWDLLADYRPAVPLILAGGLTPENVAVAVRRVRPYAVDVASGVESSPGVKDADKLRRFIDAARSA